MLRKAVAFKQTRFANAAELDTTLELYLRTYNHSIPQRALNHKTPIQTLKIWQEKKPELFIKRVYEQARLDKYVTASKSLLVIGREAGRSEAADSRLR